MADGNNTIKPNSIESENTLIGAILVDNQLFRQTAKLKLNDFHDELNKLIFGAMLELAEEEGELNAVFISRIIKRDIGETAYQTLGGIAAINTKIHGVPNLRSLDKYVGNIREASACRRVSEKLGKIKLNALTQKTDIKTLSLELDSISSELKELYAKETESFIKLSEVLNTEVVPTLEAYFKNEVSEFLISSGFPQIDEVLGGGFYLSDMVAIVAPPKSGKSALALQLALNFADAGECVGLLSLEMSNLQNGLRFIAQKSYLDSNKNHPGTVNAVSANHIRPGIWESSYRKAITTAATLFEKNIYICQNPLTWQEIKIEAHRLVKEKGLRVLIVDYWQLVQNSNGRRNRAENLSEIAQGLKSLGQELNIVVITLAQFNQAGIRKWKDTGQLSPEFIEGSGELVKSANIVITVDIDEADFNNRTAPRPGTLTFKPVRSAADAKLDVVFFGEYLTLEVN